MRRSSSWRRPFARGPGNRLPRLFLCAIALGLTWGGAASAQIAVVALDGKQVLVDGVQTVPERPAPDAVMVLDLSQGFPRIIGLVAAPTSVIGPPGSVAVSPDETFALVTSSRRIDPTDPTVLIPDDRLSVIDLTGKAPRVSATLHAGAGPSGVSISPAGDLALVTNRAEGTVSIFRIQDGVLHDAGKVVIGPASVSPAHVIFFDGGRRALVSRDGDHRISILTITDTEVRLEPQTMAPGLRPYQIDTAGPRDFAVSANIGGGGRDEDTLSLIDLRPAIPRVVDVVAAGLTPEGVKMSPDGRYVAATINNGSNASTMSPRYHRDGIVQVWRIENEGRLVRVAHAPGGAWGQGLAWSSDGKTLLAQSAADDRIDIYAFDGEHLSPEGQIPMPAGPAGIRTAEP